MAGLLTIAIPGLPALIARLEAAGIEGMGAALVRAMWKAELLVERIVKEQKLSGQVLQVRTGRLRSSITSKPVLQMGADVEGVVGTNVEYAAIHEFGGTTGRSYATSIPARPYMHPALAEAEPQIRDMFEAEVMGLFGTGWVPGGTLE